MEEYSPEQQAEIQYIDEQHRLQYIETLEKQLEELKTREKCKFVDNLIKSTEDVLYILKN